MTPEERAAAMFGFDWMGCACNPCPVAMAAVAEAIRAAVVAERKACARICDEKAWHDTSYGEWYDACDVCGDAIRGQPAP